jgi:hypothetical protein
LAPHPINNPFEMERINSISTEKNLFGIGKMSPFFFSPPDFKRIKLTPRLVALSIQFTFDSSPFIHV